MSQAASIDHIAIPQRSDGRGRACGWGISLLVHMLAVAWVWHAWPARRADTDGRAVNPIEVRLIPLASATPRAAPAPRETVPRAVPVASPAARKPAAAPQPARANAASAASSAPAASTAEPATAVPATPAAGTPPAGADTPSVDLAGARAAARLIARENPKGLVALPERKPVVDANADHHVVDRLERARRVDCQTARAESTNLLANVVMLAVDLTKNAIDDSGCKWQ